MVLFKRGISRANKGLSYAMLQWSHRLVSFQQWQLAQQDHLTIWPKSNQPFIGSWCQTKKFMSVTGAGLSNHCRYSAMSWDNRKPNHPPALLCFAYIKSSWEIETWLWGRIFFFQFLLSTRRYPSPNSPQPTQPPAHTAPSPHSLGVARRWLNPLQSRI